MKKITLAVITAIVVTGCGVQQEGATIPQSDYKVIDRFKGPDGEITLFCRKENLYLDKDGVQSGSISVFFGHEWCKE